MTKPFRYLLIAALVMLAGFLFLHKSETEKILSLLEEIRSHTEINVAESGIIQATRAKKIGQLFNEQTTYNLTNAGYSIYKIGSRQELIQPILKGRASLSSLKLELKNPQVTINGDTASVEVTGKALGSSRNSEGQFLEIHRIEIQLDKSEDNWLIKSMRHIHDERQIKPGEN
ncbi:MAG: nuclear transport factor 2 family protein [Gammaproteobacteria bacterium]